VGSPTESPSSPPTGRPTGSPTGRPAGPPEATDRPTVPATATPTRSAGPTASHAPTVETYPVTLAVQLDQWPAETSVEFAAADGGPRLADVDFKEGMSGEFYSRTFLFPLGIDVVMTVYDNGGDGMCE
ncbi:hypothetical protein THAOC_15342, partial [Thalassiosira oceanica]